MSESESVASAQLASISEKYGLDFDGKTCHFAYAKILLDKIQVSSAKTIEYIVLRPNGNLATKEINLITRNDYSHAQSEFCFVGIALKHIAPSTNVKEAINNLEQSQLVADLRDAMANGKFAPLLTPINPPLTPLPPNECRLRIFFVWLGVADDTQVCPLTAFHII
jgi:hypothetical protein